MDRQPVQKIARPTLRFLATTFCGCALGVCGGCDHTTNLPTNAVATKPNSSSADAAPSAFVNPSATGFSAAGHLTETAQVETSTAQLLAENAPQPLPPNGAVALEDRISSQVLRAAYPPAQDSDVDAAPRARLAQLQPLIPPADGPQLESPQQLTNAPNENPAAIVPLPPLGRPNLAGPISSNFAPDATAPVTVEPRLQGAERDAVSRQTAVHTARGFELAGRGAVYSARAEFIAALHTIAAALDAVGSGNRHDQMLVAGLRALDEADDFVAHGGDIQNEIDVSRIVAGHQTPVLKDVSLAGVSSTAALSRYLTFAQAQLAGCAVGVSAGSAPLYGLGKVYSLPGSMHGPADATHGAKAVVLYQAALMVDNRNYRAANELGVLLAQFGRLPEARASLLHSLSISPQPTTWQNLAAVHQSLGERDLAQRAHYEALVAAARMRRAGAGGQSAYAVQWLDPATFAATTPLNIDGTPSSRPGQPTSVAAGAAAAKR